MKKIIYSLIIIISVVTVGIFTTNEEVSAMKLTMTINDQVVAVDWADNAAVTKLKNQASQAPVKITTHAYGGFEQVGKLPSSLPTNDQELQAKPGDLMLYQGNQLVAFHGHNEWAYTRLGHLTGLSKQELTALLAHRKTQIVITAE